MASLIPGFEYDIFISYRQKDNKYDGWVTEFVDNLKKELEATFKEEVSVYFDINTHNGLLETHDVDASLKDKLKSLIFIPIISRTYCDPKSFAWEHEFMAFVEQASKDRFGLKIKLLGGNVASRVLPVRIHDLNVSDVDLFESTIGGVLRGVDFIYKSAGVNRPLRANEDHPQDNLNKTYYRDQINKVANAVEEIISSLASDQTVTGKEKTEVWEQEKEIAWVDKRKELAGIAIIKQKSKKWLIMIIALVMFFAVAFAVYKIVKSGTKSFDITKLEKSIAVLPFINDSPDQENTYFINGIMEEVLNNLQKVKDIRVLSRTSTEQYRGFEKPTIPEIAKKLNVNFIVEGSGQRYGNTFRIRVQLIEANNERHLWGESYEQEIRETKDIFRIQSQVAQSIAEELKATITPDEKQLIERPATTSLTAYDFYQRGKDELNKSESDNNKNQILSRAKEMFDKSLKYDSSFARAYIGLADIYWAKHWTDTYYSENYLDSVLILADRAISFDDHLAEGYHYRGEYYSAKGQTGKALKEYNVALKYNPNYWEVYYALAQNVYFYNYEYMDFIKGLEYLHKVVSIYHGKDLPFYLCELGDAYGGWAGYPEKREYYFREAFKLDNDSSKLNDFKSDKEKLESLLKEFARDSSNLWTILALNTTYSKLGQYKEAFKYTKKIEKRLDDVFFLFFSGRTGIGYTYWQNGYKKEALKWFNDQRRMSEESLKLGRSYSMDAYCDLANIYALTGENDKAYECLKIYAQNHVFPYFRVGWIKEDPMLNSIRSEPDFQKIVKEIEAKYQAEHERVRKWLEEQGKL